MQMCVSVCVGYTVGVYIYRVGVNIWEKVQGRNGVGELMKDSGLTLNVWLHMRRGPGSGCNTEIESGALSNTQFPFKWQNGEDAVSFTRSRPTCLGWLCLFQSDLRRPKQTICSLHIFSPWIKTNFSIQWSNLCELSHGTIAPNVHSKALLWSIQQMYPTLKPLIRVALKLD